jgi:hypothetical protein
MNAESFAAFRKDKSLAKLVVHGLNVLLKMSEPSPQQGLSSGQHSQSILCILSADFNLDGLLQKGGRTSVVGNP